MEVKELQKKSIVDLQKLLADSRAQLRELRFKVANEQLKNIREIRALKKTIARILMLMGQKAARKAPKQEKTT